MNPVGWWVSYLQTRSMESGVLHSLHWLWRYLIVLPTSPWSDVYTGYSSKQNVSCFFRKQTPSPTFIYSGIILGGHLLLWASRLAKCSSKLPSRAYLVVGDRGFCLVSTPSSVPKSPMGPSSAPKGTEGSTEREPGMNRYLDLGRDDCARRTGADCWCLGWHTWRVTADDGRAYRWLVGLAGDWRALEVMGEGYI